MAGRLHLHIGTMKSATTYLQDLCELNIDHLAEAGVLWPAGPVRYAGIRALFGRADEQTDPPAAWQTLLGAIRDHPGEVVLSNELLAGLETPRVRRLVEALSPAVVHVVITARDSARVIPSAWQTAIRNGEKTYRWSDFAASVCSDTVDQSPDGIHGRFWHQHDVAAVARRWLTFVPPERVTVVTVPPAGCERELVAGRFGTAVGVDLTGLSQPPTRGNSSLGAYSAELIRRVNVAFPGGDRALRKYGIRNALADVALAAQARREPEFGLTPEQYAWAVGRAQRMAEEISSLNLVVQGDLADLVPATGPAPEITDPGDATDSELLEASVQGLVAVAQHAATLRRRSNELRREIERLTDERDALLRLQKPPSGSAAARHLGTMRGILRRISR